jgi:simple sugar transport system permease protein
VSTLTGTAGRGVSARPRRAGGLTRHARTYALQIGILGVAIVIWGLFVIGAPRTFLSPQIYTAYMSTTPFFAIIAIPLTLVIISGEIDLSFPSIMAFGMLAFSVTFNATRSGPLAVVACLLAGAVAGLINGAIVVKLGIPSLVATLGTQFFWRGLVNVVTGGNGSGLTAFQGSLLHQALVGKTLTDFLPAQMIWTILVAVLVWVLLNRHRFGAHVYLVGDNVESARLMGVNAARVKMLAFGLVGLAAAFAGLVVSLQLLYYWPTLGDGYLLNTLASVFLGGTSVFGGSGTIFGTFVGAFIIGAINAGIVAVGLSGFWTQLIYGLIIVISVSLQTLIARKLA